jgi:hypothetical protein
MMGGPHSIMLDCNTVMCLSLNKDPGQLHDGCVTQMCAQLKFGSIRHWCTIFERPSVAGGQSALRTLQLR